MRGCQDSRSARRLGCTFGIRAFEYQADNNAWEVIAPMETTRTVAEVLTALSTFVTALGILFLRAQVVALKEQVALLRTQARKESDLNQREAAMIPVDRDDRPEHDLRMG